MFNDFNAYRPFPTRIHLKTKKKINRIPNIRFEEDVWNFLRQHGVISVIIDQNMVKFRTNDRKLLLPVNFFNGVAEPIKSRRKENNTIYLGYKIIGLQSMTISSKGDYRTYKTKEIYGPKDKELDKKLSEELNTVSDFYYSWEQMSDLVRVGAIVIPEDLRMNNLNINPIGAIENKIEKKLRNINLSPKENLNLNRDIVKVVDTYIDNGETQEKSFQLASANAEVNFKQWKSKFDLSELSKGVIEGRYKRFNKNPDY